MGHGQRARMGSDCMSPLIFLVFLGYRFLMILGIGIFGVL
jgi:hypothetical protein